MSVITISPTWPGSLAMYRLLGELKMLPLGHI
jgi:hypothetical protein